ncbi:hypothetical protein [Bradyrhizobium sp. 1]|uniref:hypothetical protein n=1 Tax=Bradyrhizobium sp. 1 TaxID=241591 RepID=UPI003211A12A
MRGFRPSPDRTITFQNGSFRSFPELRWVLSDIGQLVPTVNVRGGALVLPWEWYDIGASISTMMDGRVAP